MKQVNSTSYKLRLIKILKIWVAINRFYIKATINSRA
jgi:hypothetical protein